MDKKKTKLQSGNIVNTELEELKEWQDNQYNPGYYIGTGRIPAPIKAIAKRSKLRYLYLLFFIIPIFTGLILSGFSWMNTMGLMLVAGTIAAIIWDSKKRI